MLEKLIIGADLFIRRKNNVMELTDRELAIRWFNQKTDAEKAKLAMEAKFPRPNYSTLTGSEIEYIWRNQKHNQ